MADITAKMVKEFRDKTGAGMMEAKKVLTETKGDFESAERLLRERGLLKAAKKADRETGEGGIIAKSSSDGKEGILLELRCETDFVARNPAFGELLNELADEALADSKVVSTETAPESLKQKVVEAVTKLGENIQLGRIARETLSGDGVIGEYVHGGGRIGVLVKLSAGKADTVKKDDVQTLVRDVAMQIAAMAPKALDGSGLDQAWLDEQKTLFMKQIEDEGKPANIAEKIVGGRMKKLQSEVCLLDMPFVKQEDLTVQKHVDAVGKAVGDTLKVEAFSRIELGVA